ncbi:hypothetical protein [Leptospira sarikeiensis]|uniref:Uncharacterized protein n=1 Tax=Leptospira sarikeiensis TaxID=2484943 RepID=A0A4R9K3N5_9LEPT|nr:hypothetical protein [Leptospira sarikeiensis]TGL60679.1 hypothetical protein EHQ64_12710 [Leptospira sarikeiensis]
MFKKIFISFVLTLVLIECSSLGKVKITKDNYKNVHAVNLKLKLKSEDPGAETLFGTSKKKYSVTIDFTREIGQDKVYPTVARFSLRAPAQYGSIEKSGFLKINEKTSSLTFGNATAQTITKVNANVTPMGVIASSQSHKELSGTFLLKKEDEDSILQSSEFTIRLYAGSEPITILVADKSLILFKEYLRAKPEAGN